MTPKRVAIIGTNWPTYELYCPNWVGMQDGLTTLGIEHRLFTCRPRLNIDALVEYDPDLVVYGLVDMVRNYEARMEIRSRLPKAKIVLWYGDYRSQFTGQTDADLSEIDMMFVSNDAQRDFYRSKWKAPDCLYLPLGSKLYNTEYKKQYDFDFVFIGGKITGRAFVARAIEIYKFQSEHGMKYIDGPVSHPELRAKVFKMMPTIYRSSKITLDQSHFTDVLLYTSNRHWIITASGGFALTKRFPGCEEAYPVGTRAYFDTFEEAISLKDYYLAHPDEREAIRLAGYEQAKQHTYDHRFRRMFQLLA